MDVPNAVLQAYFRLSKNKGQSKQTELQKSFPDHPSSGFQNRAVLCYGAPQS